MKAILFALLISVFTFCVQQTTRATTVLQKSFSDLVADSDTILVGTVSEITNGQENGVPHTYVTFEDLEVVKGTHTDPTYTASVMGGTAPDGSRMTIAGVPQFEAGNQMVVFIQNNGVQAVPFVGMWQGVFNVNEEQTITNHAHSPVTTLPTTSGNILHDESHMQHGHATQEQRLKSDGNEGRGKPFTLDEFVNAIEDEPN